MNSIRWGYGPEEMTIQPWWQAVSGLPRSVAGQDQDYEWMAVHAWDSEHCLGAVEHGSEQALRMRAMLTQAGADVSRLRDHQVIARVVWMLASRDLVLFKKVLTAQAKSKHGTHSATVGALDYANPGSPSNFRSQRDQALPRQPAPAPLPFFRHAKPSHWIEIELVGEDERPIPDEEYEVMLPNRDVVRGILDASGWARIDDIVDPGACLVSFPRLDKAAWRFDAKSPVHARENP